MKRSDAYLRGVKRNDEKEEGQERARMRLRIGKKVTPNGVSAQGIWESFKNRLCSKRKGIGKAAQRGGKVREF